MSEEVPTAHTLDELRNILQELGLSQARQVVVATGHPGEVDATVYFRLRGATKAIRFHTQNIPIDAAHKIVRELTRLLPSTPVQKGPQTITVYF